MMEEALMSEKGKLFRRLGVLVMIITLLIAIIIVNQVKEYRYIGSGFDATNTIRVTGQGDAFTVPDIAQFTYTVRAEARTFEEAQETAAKVGNTALDFLIDEGIEEKDIKTTSYNIYPRYEYPQIVCITFPCPQGERELVGYEATQNVSVKVRDIERAGNILSGVGSSGVSNLSGLSFMVDDPDEIQREARKDAIDDAKGKAKELAKDLGISLVRIVSFSEGGGYGGSFARFDDAVLESLSAPVAISPAIPIGENQVRSNVTITYEIR